MDIGTAKPTRAERAAVPHHLIDVTDPDEAYSVGRWREAAIRACLDILDRNKLPLLVGGTMLYYRSLAAGLDALPARDPAVRAEIDADAAARGWPALHADLARLDPQSARRIKPNDAQRIQRALEVVRLTGRPLSELQGGEKTALPFALKGFALVPPDRAALHRRIEARFDAMLREGLVEEVAALRRRFSLDGRAASMRAVGYRQVLEHLEGRTSAGEMRDRALAATRQLAKRQMTWLRSPAAEFSALPSLDADTVRLEDLERELHSFL